MRIGIYTTSYSGGDGVFISKIRLQSYVKAFSYRAGIIRDKFELFVLISIFTEIVF